MSDRPTDSPGTATKPPRKNKVLLIASSVLLAAWLGYLVYLIVVVRAGRS